MIFLMQCAYFPRFACNHTHLERVIGLSCKVIYTKKKYSILIGFKRKYTIQWMPTECHKAKTGQVYFFISASNGEISIGNHMISIAIWNK